MTLIVFKTKRDNDLLEKIINFLRRWSELAPNDKTTFSGIARGVGLNLDCSQHWHKLRLHLWYLEKNGVIEERHFPSGQVDYFLQTKPSK